MWPACGPIGYNAVWLAFIALLQLRGGFVLHLIAAAGRSRRRFVAAHGPHIRDKLPDLICRNAPAPRWHTVGPAFRNRVEDVVGLAAVGQIAAHQRRPHAAAAIRMT